MGAQVIDGGRVRFRVWAPEARAVEVETYPPPEGIVRYGMTAEDGGWWSATIDGAAGLLYRYRLNGDWGYPDPCSRSQPEGVHGPSQVVDSRTFAWSDGDWAGLDAEQLVIYELHIGAYTPQGTFDGVIERLDDLRELGVTALELMPVAEFPGRRNWGYDGVCPYAPSSVYGGADGLRRLVEAAHERGLGVILDVVYNHLGPDGNYLPNFASQYFTDRYQTPWGDAINFDGENSRPVRQFFVQNALYWLHEYHVDGLRLDATHTMYDAGPKHILQEIVEAVDERGPAERRSLVMAEDERNELRILLPRDAGGYGLDGLWVDDFHHAVHVLLTGDESGYLRAYEGTASEIAQLLRVGFLYHSPPREAGAEPAGIAPAIPARQLIYCLQNHDQVGNRPFGRRLCQLADLEGYKAATALLLLVPCTPLMFMGDEFAASTPFLFFTDHEERIGEWVAAGRMQEFGDMWAAREPNWPRVPNPQDDATFLQSRLDLQERLRPPHDGVLCLWRELLRLRREDPVLATQDRWRLLAEAPAEDLVAVERWDDGGQRRLALVNFGSELVFELAGQAWLGDAAGLEWQPVLSTAEKRFGGPGGESPVLRPGEAVRLPRRCALVYAAKP